MSTDKQEEKKGITESQEWAIADGSKITPGEWYHTKRGRLVICKKLMECGCAIVTSHYSGNDILLRGDQLIYFKKTSSPKTPCGTMLINNPNDSTSRVTTRYIKESTQKKHDAIYKKYPHVIPGSIYQAKSIRKDVVKQYEKKVFNKKSKILGQTRCKIACIHCGAERDIKVQSCFNTKICLDCKAAGKKSKIDG